MAMNYHKQSQAKTNEWSMIALRNLQFFQSISYIFNFFLLSNVVVATELCSVDINYNGQWLEIGVDYCIVPD